MLPNNNNLSLWDKLTRVFNHCPNTQVHITISKNITAVAITGKANNELLTHYNMGSHQPQQVIDAAVEEFQIIEWFNHLKHQPD